MIMRRYNLIKKCLNRKDIRFIATPTKVLSKEKGKNTSGDSGVIDYTKEVPINIFKDGKNPELKDMSEYPEWLGKLLDPQIPGEELERRGFNNLNMDEMKRYLDLAYRERIKTRNESKSKKNK